MTTTVTPAPASADDDILTVIAISLLAMMLADMLHEGAGHSLPALLTGAQSGVLSTVAWSSNFDSRLVAAGGTLVNLAAAGIFWAWLGSARNASVRKRYFLLLSCAFNLLGGTGYFFFSGMTDFGDWAVVIQPMRPHWLWRTLLVVAGLAAYYAAVLLLGIGFVRYLGVRMDSPRLSKLTFVPYISAIVLMCAAALFNPVGMRLMWESALPATAGGHSGLLWFRYYVPGRIVSVREGDSIRRSHGWIMAAAVLSLIFVLVIGRGITISR